MLARPTLTNLILSAAVVLPGSFLAADDQFDRQDSNKDGVLSGREATDVMALDEDGDGEISQAEFEEAIATQRTHANTQAMPLFALRDTNEDKRLSGTEMSGFEDFDTNGDRRITEMEFKAGILSGDPALREMSFAEIRKIADDRFSKLDINEDGRLSGTEAAGSGHFDRNNDTRIVKEEYITGLILSAASTDSATPDDAMPAAPITEDRVHKTLADFIKALDNAANAKLITGALHKSVVHEVDLPIFEYALKYAKSSHGRMKLPPKSEIRITSLEGGDVRAEADLKCEKGALKLAVRFSEGQIIGFVMDSPETQVMEAALYRDLSGDELQQRFANFYAVIAEGLLDTIMKGEDGVAAAWVHPSVIEQVGRDKFIGLFQQVREKLTEVKSTELETFAMEISEDEIRSFTVTQIVTGTSGILRYSTTFQFVGMNGVVTGLAISDASDVVPSPSPEPVGPPVADMSANWFETVSLRDGVSFRTPGEASRTEQEPGDGGLTRFAYEMPGQEMMFQIDVIKLKVDISTESKTFFDTVRTQLVEDTGAKLLQERLLDQDGPLPSQVLVVQKENGQTTILRSVVDGSRVYSFLWVGATLDDNTDQNFARPFHESINLVDEEGSLRPGFTTAKSKGSDAETPAAENATLPAPPASSSSPRPRLPSFLKPKAAVQTPSDDDLAPPPAPLVDPVDPVAPPAPIPAPAPPM